MLPWPDACRRVAREQAEEDRIVGGLSEMQHPLDPLMKASSVSFLLFSAEIHRFVSLSLFSTHFGCRFWTCAWRSYVARLSSADDHVSLGAVCLTIMWFRRDP
eukprot:1236993-Rhodomonas_salina.1